jgi:DNA-binding transcriptional LysR family regulator
MHSMQQLPRGVQLEEWVAFSAVVEHASFARAADALERDATVISRRISALERRLGVRLIERTTRRLAPTEAGQQFYERVKVSLDDIAEAEAEATAHGGVTARGTLRVSLPIAFGQKWIAPRLPSFIDAHPGLTIEAHFNDRYVDLIGEGFDAAVRLGNLPDSSLVMKRIASRRRMLVASPAYLAGHGEPRTPDDLRDHPCLHFFNAAGYPDWRFCSPDGRERRTVRVRGPLVSDDSTALVIAAVEGLGIMMVTDWLVSRELADGTLVEVMKHWPMDDDGAIYVMVPSGRFLATKTRVFRDWMVAQFSGHAPWEVK